MKKNLLIYLIPGIVLCGLVVLFNKKSDSIESHETTGQENPLEKLEWEHNRLADPATGKIPSIALWKAYLDLVEKGKMNAGPFYSQANTRDANWQQVNDFFASLSITKITYDPNNTQTFYFSTGENWYNADYSAGAGVFKSEDGGNSWNQLASTANASFSYCNDIDVHPLTSDVYVATVNSGLMRSKDGGATWKRVLSVPGSFNNSVCDVEFTKNGNLFATTGIFQAGGIWYSDSGDSGTWVKQTNGFPTSGIYRVELATAPSNDSVAYAVPCNSSTFAIKGIYKTTDKGNTWNQVANPGDIDTMFAHFQAWYDLVLAVNPTDENDVFGGGWKLWRTKDGGNSWYQISHNNPDSSAYQFVHVDEHAIVFRNADTVYIGNDGGLWKTGNFSDSLPNIYERNYGYRVTQYYAGDVAPEAGNPTVIGGSQDNGSTLLSYGGISPVTYLTGYDGGYCAINYQNPSIMYTTKNSNGVFRKKNYGLAIADTLRNPYLTDDDVQFINPIALDKADPEILYMGSNKGVYRLKNASTAIDSDWVQASKPLSGIAVIAVSESQPHTLYLGRSSSAKIYRLEHADTSTGTHAIINCDLGNKLPTGGIGSPIACSGIYVDPEDVNHVISVYSNYGIKNIWESHDATAPTPNWISQDGDLPNMPVYSAYVHPDHPEVCYIGTELGVFYTTQLNGDNTVWNSTNTGLANVRVTDLLYKPSDHTLTAMTYGRGVFVANIPAGPDYSLSWTERGPLDVGGRTRAIMIDPNDPTGQTIWAGAVSGGLWKTTNVDELPFVGINATASQDFSLSVFPNPVYDRTIIQLSLNQSSAVNLLIFDNSGKQVAELWNNRKMTSGMHQLQWNPEGNVTNGIYFVVAESGNRKMVKKIVLMR